MVATSQNPFFIFFPGVCSLQEFHSLELAVFSALLSETHNKQLYMFVFLFSLQGQRNLFQFIDGKSLNNNVFALFTDAFLEKQSLERGEKSATSSRFQWGNGWVSGKC